MMRSTFFLLCRFGVFFGQKPEYLTTGHGVIDFTLEPGVLVHMTGYVGLNYVGNPQSPWRTSHISVYPTEKQTPTLS